MLNKPVKISSNPLVLDVCSWTVVAGFPSPAADYTQQRIDLNNHLIRNKDATYLFRVKGDSMINAGIYENDEFCLITEEAKENVKKIHHRQPVIINETDINRYLNLELQGSTFLKECKKTDLTFYEVSKDVNKPTNNSASLIQAII